MYELLLQFRIELHQSSLGLSASCIMSKSPKSLQRPAGFEGCRFGEASLPGRKGASASSYAVPVPPKTGKPHAPRGWGPRDRLRGGHLKGMLARDSLRDIVRGSDPKLGRWSNNKTIYTELLEVMQSCSITFLVSTLSRAQAAGASNWPEFAKVRAKLQELERIRRTMEEASEWICVDDMERLMHRASAAGIIQKVIQRTNEKIIEQSEQSVEQSIEPEFQHLVFALKKRIQKLQRLREDLRTSCTSSDIEWISNLLEVARELGPLGVWEEAAHAEARS
eukprot:Skav236407  [mRNA]  locus=scaffold1702:195203:196039:- [translate_table: standard]